MSADLLAAALALWGLGGFIWAMMWSGEVYANFSSLARRRSLRMLFLTVIWPLPGAVLLYQLLRHQIIPWFADAWRVAWESPPTNGGPVLPPGPYIIGERGPELFLPQTAQTDPEPATTEPQIITPGQWEQPPQRDATSLIRGDQH